MASNVLEFEHVAVEVGQARLLADVNLTVKVGQKVGIVGETGSGKSLTCRVALGMMNLIGGKVVSGRVRFKGRDVTDLDARSWRRLRRHEIGFIPQSSIGSLYPLQTVGDQLVSSVKMLEPDMDPRIRALELLDQVQMADADRVTKSYPHELSGGMRQRIMIALALTGKPSLLIADEPTTALDVSVQRGILELIHELTESSGMALVFVTHDLGVVEDLCDRVNVMYAGEMLEIGSVGDVLRSPGHPYTRQLIASDVRHARPGAALPVIDGSPPSPENRPAGCPFVPRCDASREKCTDRATTLEACGSGGDHLTSCWRVSEMEI